MRLFIILIGFFLSLLSCKRLEEKRILKGTWELKYYELKNSGTNLMEVVLPFYQASQCRYIIDFKEEGICTGTYYIADTVFYKVTGSWDQLDFHELYLQLDHYVNGVYEVDKVSREDYILYSPKNLTDSTYFNIEGEVELTIERIDI